MATVGEDITKLVILAPPLLVALDDFQLLGMALWESETIGVFLGNGFLFGGR